MHDDGLVRYTRRCECGKPAVYKTWVYQISSFNRLSKARLDLCEDCLQLFLEDEKPLEPPTPIYTRDACTGKTVVLP